MTKNFDVDKALNAIEQLESIVKGADGELWDAIRMAVDALKEKTEAEACASGACIVHFEKEG